MKCRARKKPERCRVQRKSPVYLKATSLPESRSRGVFKAVPGFRLCAQLTEAERLNRRTIGKVTGDRVSWGDSGKARR